MPPPQYYTIFRPLLNISPANPSRIELAEKAIAINAKEKGLSWDAAAKDFVAEQQELSKAEYSCLKDKSCENLNTLARIMAGYILAPDPKLGSEVKA
ncbi:MAG: hypothetical protein LUC43_04325 [Burkholderiales bacterium]|nr:hypothetical protein [Burkholderiales bacterium]